ncbi:MAG: MFS family permease [Oceanicoccus sp.]
MFTIPYPVWLIALAQALGMLTAPMVIFVGGFLGVLFAPSAALATLPVAALVVGGAVTSMPAAFIMKRIGRRSGFVYATLLAILGSILAFYSVRNENFFGLCFSVFLLGGHMAFVQQFRFAAIEWVTADKIAMTASVVMLGGLLAAWLGPELAMQGKDLFEHTFSGSFILLALCHVALLVLLSVMPFAEIKPADDSILVQRSWFKLFAQPGIGAAIASAAVAFGVMSLIMTATPVSMSEIQNYPLDDTKIVIQSHIMAMFIPSLFAPILFRVFSLFSMLLMGLVVMSVAVTIAILDQSYWGYWSALVCLGIGWNFLYVGGTALLAQQYDQQESFTVQAMNDVCVFSTQAVMSLCAGWMVFNYGWFALNLIAVPLLMFALVLIARWYFLNIKTKQAA